MTKTKKGLFGIAFVLIGALLLAGLFLAGPKSQPTAEQETVDPEGDTNVASAREVEEPTAAQSTPTESDPPAASETAELFPGKETTLRQQIRRKTASGEYVVLFEAGEKLEVVALQGSRIYLRTPEGETIGIPLEATDWTTQEDDNPDP
jgi:hypothetical protein